MSAAWIRPAPSWLAPALLVAVAVGDWVALGSAHGGSTLEQVAPARASIVLVPAPDLALARSAPLHEIDVRPPWVRVVEDPARGWVRARTGRTRWWPVNGEAAEAGTPTGAWMVRERGVDSDSRLPWNLADRLREVRVSTVGPDGDVHECSTWNLDRWECGPEPWHWVGPTRQVVADEAVDCIWAHPVEGRTLRIEWELPPGADRLRGRYALSDAAAATEQGAPVEVVVRQGETVISRRTARNRRGWQPLRARLDGDPTRRTTTLEIAAESTGARHFCVEFRVLASSEPGGER